MKSLMTLGLLLSAIFLFSGCYTIVFVESTIEIVSLNPEPIPPVEPGPGPWPIPLPPVWPSPPPPPRPPHPPINLPPAGHNPIVPAPSPDIHRPAHTGRGPVISNPVPSGNEENKDRQSGLRRDGQTDSNPVLVRNNENNSPRDPVPQRGRH
jgi:hypothetical protein